MTGMMQDYHTMRQPTPSPLSTAAVMAEVRRESVNSMQSNVSVRAKERLTHYLCRQQGTSTFLTATIIIAEMAGGGLTSLPADVESATLTLGVVYLLFASLITLYTSYLLYAVRHAILGLVFTVSEDNTSYELRPAKDIKTDTQLWADGKLSSREIRQLMWRVWEDPYAAIAWVGMRSWAGKRAADIMVVVTRCLVSTTLTGVAIVFSVLVSRDLANSTGVLSQRAWMAIALGLIFVLSPLFGRTHDYRFITAFSALMTVAIAATTFALFALGDTPSPVHHDGLDRKDALGAYGGILFMFGGHGGMPSYHAGMRTQTSFMHAVYMAYGFIVAIMLVIGVTGPVLYGTALQSNLPDTFGHLGGAKLALTIFFIGHMVCAMPSLVGPVGGIVQRIRSEYVFCVSRQRLRDGDGDGDDVDDVAEANNDFRTLAAGTAGAGGGNDRDCVDGNAVLPVQPAPDNNDRTGLMTGDKSPSLVARLWREYNAIFIVLGVVFGVAISVKNMFLPIMGILGGTTITAVTFVLPCVFYYVFAKHETNRHFLPDNRVSVRVHAIVCVVAGVSGLGAGIIATINNIQQVAL